MKSQNIKLRLKNLSKESGDYKMLDKKGQEVVVKDLDLTGKLKQITCAGSDAIGYISREDGETIISFDSLQDVTGGTRCPHLIGKTMPMNWSEIFID